MDEESTQTTEVSEDAITEEVETSTDGELEDIEVSLEDMEVEDEPTELETPASETEEESEEDAEAEDTAAEEVKEEPKIDPAYEAWKQREAKRQEAKITAQKDYLEAAEDDRDLALRQLQIDAYNNKVEANANKLQNGIDKAVAAIDLFQTGSPEVKEELVNALDDFERMYVRKDQNGDPIEVTGDVYQFLQTKAESIRKLTNVGVRQQVKDKTKTKSRTITAPAAKPKEAAKDPLLEAFDEEAWK